MWIAAQNIFLHLFNGIIAVFQIGSIGEIAQAIFIILYFRNTAVAIFKIVQGNSIIGKLGMNMIFYADEVV